MFMRSGRIRQPGFSGFYSFRIHCAARKQKDPFSQMVSADQPGPRLDNASSHRLRLQMTLLHFTGVKPQVFQHLVSGRLK